MIPFDLRNIIDSAIIARFSSRVVSRTRVTCLSQLFPTMVTTGTPDSTSAMRLASALALAFGRLVLPNAARTARDRRSFLALLKNSSSLGLEPGHPPSIY